MRSLVGVNVAVHGLKTPNAVSCNRPCCLNDMWLQPFRRCNNLLVYPAFFLVKHLFPMQREDKAAQLSPRLSLVLLNI